MKIACIGNLTFDYVVSNNKFIDEGLRNNFDDVVYNIGGPAFNAASVISKFGKNVDFYGKIGNDIFGNYIINTIKNDNINIDHLKMSNESTTPFSFIIINTLNNTRTICTVRKSIDFNNSRLDNNYDNNYDYILTDGKYYCDTLKLIKNNPNAITIIDAGRSNKNVIELCKVIKIIICSEDFANNVTGLKTSDNYKAVYLKLKKLFPHALGIVITVGENGYIYEKDGLILNNKAYKTDLPAIDTNGAGDIFHGAFTYSLSNGNDFYSSLEFANITASLSTTKKGGRDSCPDLDEVNKRFKLQNKELIKKNNDMAS